MPTQKQTLYLETTTVPAAKSMINDSEMLDWLETFINEHGSITIHTGERKGLQFDGPGLGLRPGYVNRTLREAIATAAGGTPEPPPSVERQSAAPKRRPASDSTKKARP